MVLKNFPYLQISTWLVSPFAKQIISTSLEKLKDTCPTLIKNIEPIRYTYMGKLHSQM